MENIELYFYLVLLVIVVIIEKYNPIVLNEIGKKEIFLILLVGGLSYLSWVSLKSEKYENIENFLVTSDIPIAGIPKDIPTNEKIKDITVKSYHKYHNTSFNTNNNLSIDLSNIKIFFNTYFYFSGSYNGIVKIIGPNINIPIVSNKWYYISYNPYLSISNFPNIKVTNEPIHLTNKNVNSYNNLYIKTTSDITINTTQINKHFKFYVYYIGKNIGYISEVYDLDEKRFVESEIKLFHETHKCELIKNEWYSITYNPTYPYLYVKHESIFNFYPPELQNNLLLHYKFNEYIGEQNEQNEQNYKIYNSVKFKYDAHTEKSSQQNSVQSMTSIDNSIIYESYLKPNSRNYLVLPTIKLKPYRFTFSFWLKLEQPKNGPVFMFHSESTHHNLNLTVENNMLNCVIGSHVYEICKITSDIWHHILWTSESKHLDKHDAQLHAHKHDAHTTKSNDLVHLKPVESSKHSEKISSFSEIKLLDLFMKNDYSHISIIDDDKTSQIQSEHSKHQLQHIDHLLTKSEEHIKFDVLSVKHKFYIASNTNDYNPEIYEIDTKDTNYPIIFNNNAIGKNSELNFGISDFRVYNDSSDIEFGNLLFNISKYQKHIDNEFSFK